MSIAKVIEITCESTKSFEDAIKEGLAEASKTVYGHSGGMGSRSSRSSSRTEKSISIESTLKSHL